MHRKRGGNGSRGRINRWNPGGVHHEVQRNFQSEWPGLVSKCKGENEMATSPQRNMDRANERLAMKTPPVVSAQEWETARQQLLVKEKALTRSRDALAAERRRMPWLAVEKKYEFEGPKGKVSLLDRK